MYSVKEVFYSLQGEGHHTGRPALFCRFSGCNLWNGKEASRDSAICNFCDTDFIGTDGAGGGKFAQPQALADHLFRFWPANQGHRYVIFTGGEPLLQLDEALIKAVKALGFEVGVETNGTKPAPEGIDWLCVSPKGASHIVIDQCDELKLVFGQPEVGPEDVSHIQARYYYLSPKNPPKTQLLYPSKQSNVRDAIDYCLAHPKWQLTLQTHKILDIE